MDTFAGAAETGQEIGRIVGEAGTRGGRGDLRSTARQAGPSAERQSEPARAGPNVRLMVRTPWWNRRHTAL